MTTETRKFLRWLFLQPTTISALISQAIASGAFLFNPDDKFVTSAVIVASVVTVAFVLLPAILALLFSEKGSISK